MHFTRHTRTTNHVDETTTLRYRVSSDKEKKKDFSACILICYQQVNKKWLQYNVVSFLAKEPLKDIMNEDERVRYWDIDCPLTGRNQFAKFECLIIEVTQNYLVKCFVEDHWALIMYGWAVHFTHWYRSRSWRIKYLCQFRVRFIVTSPLTISSKILSA